MASILFKKVLPGLVVAGGLFFLGSYIYSRGHQNGENKVQLKWNQEKEETAKAFDVLERKYDELEAENRKATEDHARILSKLTSDHEMAIGDIRGSYAIRLRGSENRGQIYQRQAEAGAVEARNLADHATKLDRTIEDGRRVVEELRAVIKLRDYQIIILGQQIKADRAVIESDADGQDTATR